MRWISTRAHAIVDFALGILLLAVPSLFGMPWGSQYSWFAAALGVAILVYSLATAYEWGLFKKLPVGAHLVLDALVGLAFIAAPWVLAMPPENIIPLTVIGLIVLAMAVMTDNDVGSEDHFTAMHLGETTLRDVTPTDESLRRPQDVRDRERRAS